MLANSQFIVKLDEFIAHWESVLAAMPPVPPFVIFLPDVVNPYSCAQLVALRGTLLAQQNTVQSRRNLELIARGSINLKKTALLEQFGLFTEKLDYFYSSTEYYEARPYAPSFNDGQELFTSPLIDMMTLWETLNGAPAPAGVTLPLTLTDGSTQGAFASAISALQFSYAAQKKAEQNTAIARGARNITQALAYEVMKIYREAVACQLKQYPVLVDTLPRLSPLPGHTPDAVNASAVLLGLAQSKVVYDASTDAMLHSYQLRGTVGDHYDEEDAVVIATNAPGAPREFITPFGLNQPGAKVALKVFVILTTDNEAGSAPMLVERAVNIPLAA